MAYGVTTSSEKAPPSTNMNEPMMTNGAAYFRSCACRPGAMNAQTCQRMPGDAMNRPVMRATFICTQNASAGAVKTSL